MAKDLPYFKFFCSEWNDGDITLESYEAQGLFINICSYYWSNECDVDFDKLLKKFRGYDKIINDLNAEGILKINEDKTICISFLDEQKEEREQTRKIKSKGGKASAEARRLKKLKQKPNNNPTENEHVLNLCSTETQLLREEKIREEEIRKEKIKEDEVKDFDFDAFYDLDVLANYYLSKDQIVNAVISLPANKIKDKEHLENRMKDFKQSLIEQGRVKETFKEFAKYFRNWVKSVEDYNKKPNEIPNPNNEKIITFTSNANPSRQQLPESEFLSFKERMQGGGYIFKIIE